MAAIVSARTGSTRNAASARNAATASLLPPPSPAPIGTRFSRKNFAPVRGESVRESAVAATNAAAAFKTRLPASTGTAGSSHESVN